MIFLKKALHRLSKVSLKSIFPFSTYSAKNHKYKVLISKANDIFSNLALEEWLYNNVDLDQTSTLLMWKNKPCVVVGRHQNPWLECHVEKSLSDGISIARRGSGGGTVYHDEGNLNCSFIKHKTIYNREENLRFIIDAINSCWDIDLSLNCREDIMMDDLYKISGTASRLTRERTFHHLTLLYDADLSHLQEYLTSPLSVGVSSKATPSRVSQVKNMSENCPDMTFKSLSEVIGEQFLKKYADVNSSFLLEVVDPTNEQVFPGIHGNRCTLESWDWIYGKTPKFTITKDFFQNVQGEPHNLKVIIVIEKGIIEDLTLTFDNNETPIELVKDCYVHLHGVRYSKADILQSLDLIKESQLSEASDIYKDRDIAIWTLKSIRHCFNIN